MVHTKYLILCQLLIFVLCSSCSPGLKVSGKAGSLTVEARTPQPIPLWVLNELEEAGYKGSLYSRALFGCSNHATPPKKQHIVESLDKMKKSTKEYGCTGWRFVGGITRMKRRLHGLDSRYQDLDSSVFDSFGE